MRAASPLGQAVKRRISQVPTRSFCAWCALRPRQGRQYLA